MDDVGRWLRGLSTICVLLALLLLLALAGVLGYARLTGAQLVVVTGGSMVPTYDLGEGLVVRPLRAGELRAGLPITFRSPRGTLTTHRVLSLREVEGRQYVQTKGDANAHPDPDLTPVAAIAGHPVVHVSHGDTIAWLVLSPRGRLLLFALPLLLLVLIEGRQLRAALAADPGDDAPEASADPGDDAPEASADPGDDAPEASADPGDDAPEASARPRSSRVVAGQAGQVAMMTVLCLLTLVLTATTAVGASGAVLTGSTALTGNLFTTATLSAPTALSAVAATSQVDLSWTATVSAFATGYQVLRGSASGGPYSQIATVVGRTTTTYSDTTATGTVYYVVRATYQSWTSADSGEATATIGGIVTTAYTSCTAQAFDTGGKGDGYEGSPMNACSKTDGGAFATDAASGTNKLISCTDPGKDRHRFSSYTLPVPTTATAINGIEVQIIGAPSTGNQTGQVCIELSGDGGATWTTVSRTINYTTTTFTTFTLGGPTDLWGKTWTPTTFSNANFRLRVTDVDNTGNKAFYLDYVGVRVTYNS